jgi:hypothetical protein
MSTASTPKDGFDYLSVDEFLAFYPGVSRVKAQKIVDLSRSLGMHGSNQPEWDADRGELEKWVREGRGMLVSLDTLYPWLNTEVLWMVDGAARLNRGRRFGGAGSGD